MSAKHIYLDPETYDAATSARDEFRVSYKAVVEIWRRGFEKLNPKQREAIVRKMPPPPRPGRKPAPA